MSNILCFDANGNPLKRMYQWDINQTISVIGLPNEPTVFHFCAAGSNTVYEVVPDEVEDGFIVTVPNILLTDNKPILMYSYQQVGEDAYRTTLLVQIPVMARAKPTDYVYGDNMEHYTLTTLNARISHLIATISGDQTGDIGAEVVDIRQLGNEWNNGVPYTVAGDAVRDVANTVHDLSDAVLNTHENEVSIELDTQENDGYCYNTDGERIESSAKQCAFVPVNSGEVYRLSTLIGAEGIPAILFFSGVEYKGYSQVGDGTTNEYLTDYEFTIDENIDTIIVQSVSSATTMTLKRVITTTELKSFTKPESDARYATKNAVDALDTRVPEAPSGNGDYMLKASVYNGTTTYSWASVQS